MLAYLLSRLPATYAVAAAVFEAVREAAPDFAPKSLADIGAGPGTASWAALETWPDIAQVSMTDSNSVFLNVAKTLAFGSPSLGHANFIAHNLGGSAPPPMRADLVTACFVLAEIAPPALSEAVNRLWSASAELLILIEPGTPAGFARIRAARKRLIEQGAHVLAPCTHARCLPDRGSGLVPFLAAPAAQPRSSQGEGRVGAVRG